MTLSHLPRHVINPHPDSHSCTQLISSTLTNFSLRDNLYRDTAPVPYSNFIYLEKNSAVYLTCTATAPAPNKICTWIAKSTPYLSCHRDNFPAKVPGPVVGWLCQVTCYPCRQAPRYPDILCRDLTLGPLYCRAFIVHSNNRLTPN